ncbi:MAG: hypothetical protein HYZ75_00765 [Elusimicrobia bacterium]|nr:hypothetical protein [Elusimicrobiota bacterium]
MTRGTGQGRRSGRVPDSLHDLPVVCARASALALAAEKDPQVAAVVRQVVGRDLPLCILSDTDLEGIASKVVQYGVDTTAAIYSQSMGRLAKVLLRAVRMNVGRMEKAGATWAR